MAKHRWATFADEYPEDWTPDEPGGSDIQLFAGMDEGHHNGPRCTVCGLAGFCHHCEPERMDEECPGVKP